MARYKFVVMTNSCDGREDDLERWYTDGHVDDMLAGPGFQSAERLAVVGGGPYQNLVLLDIETDDLDGLFAECARRDGTPLMPSSDALDRTRMFTCVFRPVG